MKSKPFEVWDDRNCGSESAQIQITSTPEEAVEEFGRQYEIRNPRMVWVRDPDDLLAEPKQYKLIPVPLPHEFDYAAVETADED